jgi:phosphoserine phosphatase
MLRARNVDSLIATVSWSFAARALADAWGFSTGCGADLETDPAGRVFTGDVSRHFAPTDKVAFAVGDSRSDLPLFEAVGFSVALNATNDARTAANTVIDDDSFLTALRAVPGLLH